MPHRSKTLHILAVLASGTTLLFLVTITMFGSPSRHAAAAIAGCPTFPADNIWNTRIDTLPVDSLSATYIGSIGANTGVHPDFGSGLYQGQPIGIPYTTVLGSQVMVPIHFTAFGPESDPGPYPIPPDAPIEGGATSTGDRHVLVVDQGNCTLYELYRAFPQTDVSWNADSGAIFPLNSNGLRQSGWTSADAAGLPILPGLVRYDEVAAGEITHALRFTTQTTKQSYIWPARHWACNSCNNSFPPMGQRFRLKSSFGVSGYPQAAQVILTALKRYGMFVADNGSDWYLSGAPDSNWNNDELVTWLGKVKGYNFEAVDESGLMVDPNSARVRQALFALPLNLPILSRY